ncbi:MAG: extracellular solute-binding protein [Planctomycetota bacterium]|nr:extracellular solute-binding protein [Planctomycetota bacterium]
MPDKSVGPAGGPGSEVVVTFPYYDPAHPEEMWTRPLIELMRHDPDLVVRRWGGIYLPGSAGRASLLMAIAGDTAPDFFYCWFHVIRSDIKQGFLYPLNEWIGEDTNGNGQIDLEEAKWDGWAKIPSFWRRVATQDGKVYGIPYAGILYFGLVYRKDMVQSAGLDPEGPPQTWDEFFYWCQKLTFPKKEIPGARLKRGQRGFAVHGDQPWFWLPWVQAAGGSPIVQARVSPTTGKEYVFAMEEETYRAPDTGEDLSRQPSDWRANFSSPEAMEACAFYHKLRWAPWIRDPQDQEPINLTEADLKRGSARVGGREVKFGPEDVIRGVARAGGGQEGWGGEMFERGEVAFQQWDIAALEDCARRSGLPPELIGMCAIPAMDKNHQRVFQGHKHFLSMTEGVGRRSQRERDKVWECIKAVTSEETRDYEIRQKVIRGNAMWCRPDDLRRLRLDEYLAEVPASIKKQYEEIERGDIAVRTEPFVGFWQTAADNLARHALTLIVAENGEGFDYGTALKKVDDEANSGGMFEMPEAKLAPHRPLARVLVGVCAIVMLTCVGLILREKTRARAGTSGAKYGGAVPWLMMAPALLTIGLWSYYPLFQGVLLAFQDYHIVGESKWVGLNNFIAAAIDSNTWTYIWKTFVFVFWTMLLGFVSPIVLAFLFAEIPKGKIFFRTLFFLPQMSAGIVVTLLWKMMYNETENGTLNRLILAWNQHVAQYAGFLTLNTQHWLQDPALAMVCCILPGVWAGAGISSLIYIAALKALPDDYYEAAALDGAGIWSRVRHIALPQLTPLIIINFVGSFIGAFQSMGSIFLLTFGGPGNETMVLGMAIWKLAYNDLRFSMATTLAWFLGVGLIGFTYLQIRFLRRVEFRIVSEN